jgi:hypothetical protein
MSPRYYSVPGPYSLDQLNKHYIGKNTKSRHTRNHKKVYPLYFKELIVKNDIVLPTLDYSQELPHEMDEKVSMYILVCFVPSL